MTEYNHRKNLDSKFKDIERRLRAMEAAPQLAFSSIENGSIKEYDIEGNLSSQYGEQFDGTHTGASLAGPNPPAPTAPTVSGVLGGINVDWDGDFVGGELTPMDFARVEIHVSTINDFDMAGATLLATIETPQGGSQFISLPDTATYYVKLVTRSLSGKFSDMSAQSSGTPTLPEVGEITAPATPGGLDSTASWAYNENYLPSARFELDWDAVTVDTNGNPLTTPATYEVWWNVSGQDPVLAATTDTNTATISGLSLDVNHQFSVRAIAQVPGEFTAVVTDSFPSSSVSETIPTPNVPTASSRFGSINVQYVPVGGLPAHIARTEIGLKTTVGGTYAVAATITTPHLADTVPIPRSNASGTQFWVGVRHVTRAGATSAWVDSSSNPVSLVTLNDTLLNDTSLPGAIDAVEATADAALTAANGKNTIKYSLNAPTTPDGAGATVNDIWFRRDSGGKILGQWRWTGSAWELNPITSGAIDTVLMDTISAASTGATAALASANGKNKINFGAAAPTASTPGVPGDIFWVRTGNTITGQYLNTAGTGTTSGNTWTAQELTNATIATLDAAKITTGLLSADRVGAHTITTDKLIVAHTQNLVPNGSLETLDKSLWAPVLVYDAADKPDGLPASLRTVASQSTLQARPGNVETSGWLVEPGEQYLFEMWIKADKPNSRFFLEVRDTAGNHALKWSPLPGVTPSGLPGPDRNYPIENYTVPTTWTKITNIGVASTGVSAVRFSGFYFNHTNGTELTAQVSIAGLNVRRRVAGELIVEGSVTANKIAAGTITAGSGVIGSIDAGTITVGTMNGSRVTVNSMDADRLIAESITTDKLAAGAVTADKMNIGIPVGVNVFPNATFEDATDFSFSLYPLNTGTNLVDYPSSKLKGQITTGTLAPGPDPISGERFFAASIIGDTVANALPQEGEVAQIVQPGVAEQEFQLSVNVAIGDTPGSKPGGQYNGQDNLDVDFVRLEYFVLSKETTPTVLDAGTQTFTLSTLSGPATAWNHLSIRGNVGSAWSNVTLVFSIWAGVKAAGRMILFEDASVVSFTGGTMISNGAVTADKIQSGSISGDKLAGELILGSRIVAGDSDTGYLELDTSGLRIYEVNAGDETLVVNLPTDNEQSAYFSGAVEAQSLEINGPAVINGPIDLSTGNEITMKAGISRPPQLPSNINFSGFSGIEVTGGDKTKPVGTTANAVLQQMVHISSTQTVGLWKDGSNWWFAKYNLTAAAPIESHNITSTIPSDARSRMLLNQFHVGKFGSYTVIAVRMSNTLFRFYRYLNTALATLHSSNTFTITLEGTQSTMIPFAVGESNTSAGVRFILLHTFNTTVHQDGYFRWHILNWNGTSGGASTEDAFVNYRHFPSSEFDMSSPRGIKFVGEQLFDFKVSGVAVTNPVTVIAGSTLAMTFVRAFYAHTGDPYNNYHIPGSTTLVGTTQNNLWRRPFKSFRLGSTAAGLGFMGTKMYSFETNGKTFELGPSLDTDSYRFWMQMSYRDPTSGNETEGTAGINYIVNYDRPIASVTMPKPPVSTLVPRLYGAFSIAAPSGGPGLVATGVNGAVQEMFLVLPPGNASTPKAPATSTFPPSGVGVIRSETEYSAGNPILYLDGLGRLRVDTINDNGRAIFIPAKINGLSMELTESIKPSSGSRAAFIVSSSISTTVPHLEMGADEIQSLLNTTPAVLKLNPLGAGVQVPTPTASTHAATKAYVDAVAPDSGWVNVPMEAGYTAVAGSPLQVRKIGSVVHMRGVLDAPAATWGAAMAGNTVATIPAAYRPADTLVAWIGTNSTGTAVLVRMVITDTTGEISLRVNIANSGNNVYMSSGLCWTVN